MIKYYHHHFILLCFFAFLMHEVNINVKYFMFNYKAILLLFHYYFILNSYIINLEEFDLIMVMLDIMFKMMEKG